MATEIANPQPQVPPGRLWFGLLASAAAWTTGGIADVWLTWKACVGREQFGGAGAHPAMRMAAIAVTIALFLLVLGSGTISYRNWRRLSKEPGLQEAEGRGREEFMALLGVFVSFTLGFGVLWLALPVFILDLCMRTR